MGMRQLYELLLAAMGPTHWWPADTRFEIAAGAILTQNTAWGNVATALDRLRNADALNPWTIVGMPDDRLWELIRSTGYYRLKAQYLKAFCEWFAGLCGTAAEEDAAMPAAGSARTLPPDDAVPALVAERTDAALRDELLALRGIGGETADDILLYVFDRPAFVADRYARRMAETMGVTDLPASYAGFRRRAMAALAADGASWTVAELKELHGLIDELGKTCRTPDDWRSTVVAGYRLRL